MQDLLHFSRAVLLLAVVFACHDASAQQEFEGWHLEPGVGQAHLVMVARVVSISQVTVVEGAKTDVALREFRFQPVRRLKGIFQRAELSMTAADLGISADNVAQAPPLQEGEFRLLILVQQSGFGSMGPQGIPALGCVTAAPGATTFDERVPLLTGPDDPLVDVVETLIRVADSRSRRERATLLVERLPDVDGLAAVPLLSSLRLRADWAAADRRAPAAVARLIHDPQTPVRGAALSVLRDMLANRITPGDPQQPRGVADALREVLESDEAVTRVRLAALEALGHLLALENDLAWPRDFLIVQLTSAATHAERAAAATALAEAADPQAAAAILDALAGLPLDEPSKREAVYARAAVRLDPAGAERVLLARLAQSIAARQSLAAEIEPLGQMRSEESLPLLLDAASVLNLPLADLQQLAQALGRLGDDRAVLVLTRWLRGNNYNLKSHALAALENLDSPLAAREARPLLRTEASLAYKLRLARLIARHGFADGYSLATEHLADNAHTAGATLVLVSIDDPRTAKDLTAIVASRPDRHWLAAALTGLVALDDAAAREQLQAIVADDRHPLAADAAQAVGLSADSELLLPLATLVASRNTQIAIASLEAMRRFLSGVRSSPRGLAAVDLDESDFGDEKSLQAAAEVPVETRAALSEAVASLAVDAYVLDNVRDQALAVARLLGGERYADLLSDLADQAELEGKTRLAQVQAERRRLQRVANQP